MTETVFRALWTEVMSDAFTLLASLTCLRALGARLWHEATRGYISDAEYLWWSDNEMG